MTINFRGYVFNDAGAAVVGASVKLLDTGTADQEGSTDTTDGNGLWNFDNVSEADGPFDVEITSGSSVRRIRWDDQIHLKEIDVRNNTGATTPALTAVNFTNNASNQVAVFRSDRGTGNAADGDEVYLSFNLRNSNNEEHEFARMTADAVDVTNGEEDGQIRFSVSVDGTMTDVFTINSSESGGTDMTLDVSGDLTLDADGGDVFFKDGGTTFGSATNNSGNLIIKSGTTTAATFSGANVTFAGTVDATTDFTIGSTVITDGVITDSSGLQLVANLDIDGTADISGDVTLSGGADGALRFTNAGENSIKIPDNQASALIIEEADNAYITFVTTNSSEAITVAKATTFSVAATLATGSTIGNITLADGSITDSSGAIDFGNETLTTTGVITGGGFTIGSAAILESELELLDGLTAGTAIASKVVTTDASIDTSGQRNLTITGELDAATLDISGNVAIDGTSNISTTTIGDLTSTGDSASLTIHKQSDTVLGLNRHNGSGGGENGPYIRYYAGAGSQVAQHTYDGTDMLFQQSSDYRLKENFTAVSDGVTRVKAIKPYWYNKKNNPSHTVMGFKAHEVATAVPQAVSGDKDAVDSDGNPAYQMMDVTRILPVLVAAIQEIEARVTALE